MSNENLAESYLELEPDEVISYMNFDAETKRSFRQYRRAQLGIALTDQDVPIPRTEDEKKAKKAPKGTVQGFMNKRSKRKDMNIKKNVESSKSEDPSVSEKDDSQEPEIVEDKGFSERVSDLKKPSILNDTKSDKIITHVAPGGSGDIVYVDKRLEELLDSIEWST